MKIDESQDEEYKTKIKRVQLRFDCFRPFKQYVSFRGWFSIAFLFRRLKIEINSALNSMQPPTFPFNPQQSRVLHTDRQTDRHLFSIQHS